MKRILITGGAGFLGHHLCERLVHQEHDVVCVDNLSTGCEENIKGLMEFPNFEFIKHDITENALYLTVDEIYNLASPASPIWYQKQPIKTLETNVLGMRNILNLAQFCKARIVQASTSEVYGSPTVSPQDESYWGNVNPIGPRSCYDEGKRCAETLCYDYMREHGLDVRVARIFNTYGPGMCLEDGRVISNFIVQALSGAPLTIYGDGSQTRSFCYVDDTVDGLMRLMELGDICLPDEPSPVNLGCPHEIPIKAIAELIIAYTWSKSEITYCDLPQDDPPQRFPDITLANRLLGWEPQTSLEKGLKLTIQAFSNKILHQEDGVRI